MYREEFSFLFNSYFLVGPWNHIMWRKGLLVVTAHKSTSPFEVSGSHRLFLENPRERFIINPGRTHNRIRSPRFKASGQ